MSIFAVLDETGLTTATQEELVVYFTDAFESIYGTDINLSQDTPDGQLMMIFVQSALDLLDLTTQVYNSMDPDNASGRVLDQRCAINGIQRQAGTHTVTNITLVNSASVSLLGLDQEAGTPYTVQDNQGNRWVLIAGITISSPDSTVLAFEAEDAGAITTVPNTITTPVTIVLGVDSVNNPTTYTSLGLDEESDFDLKIRRQRSVSLSSQGYLQGLIAALENITGMTFVQVYENVTGSTDSDGIPSHSIWVIVAGTATPAQIANAIYTKRNAGCGMKGDITYSISQVDGSLFTIHWDDVEAEDLFIKFTAASLDGINEPNIAAIRSGLVTSFVPGVYEQVNINALATAVQAIDANTLVSSAGFSLTSGGAYTSTLTPTLKKNQFAVTEADIIILPMIITPAAPEVASAATQQFAALGGFGAYTFSLHTNLSGGSCTSGGLYTAGAVNPVTDVVRVTDALGNFTDINVSVIA